MGRQCWEPDRVSNQHQHSLISLIIIQMRLICFPTLVPRLRANRFTTELTVSKEGFVPYPPTPPPHTHTFHPPSHAELLLNGPQVSNNKLMNTEVVFYFFSAWLDSIHCHKRNEIHLKRRPFRSFACKLGPVME